MLLTRLFCGAAHLLVDSQFSCDLLQSTIMSALCKKIKELNAVLWKRTFMPAITIVIFMIYFPPIILFPWLAQTKEMGLLMKNSCSHQKKGEKIINSRTLV